MVMIEASALLHDLGKIGIDEMILLKPAPLTMEEKKEIDKHVLRGYLHWSPFVLTNGLSFVSSTLPSVPLSYHHTHTADKGQVHR